MAKKFDRLLEKATDETLLDPDWLGILECVDAIRSGDVTAPIAIQSLSKRIQNENPHTALYALMVLEASVKNCGEKIHKQVATREMMETLKRLAVDTLDKPGQDFEKVNMKILELIQCWAYAFDKKGEDYKIIGDTFKLMKLEGFEFPEIQGGADSDAMFSGYSAPDWADGEVCFRCRTAFTFFNRKHHCRNCGQIFCDKCSSKRMVLPHIGIDAEVRVCETCFDKLNNKEKEKSSGGSGKSAKTKDGDSMKVIKDQEEKAKKERELKEQEEEQLQLAIALSQSEMDENDRQKQFQIRKWYEEDEKPVEPPKDQPEIYKGTLEKQPATNQQADFPPMDVNPELARYLNRDFWQKKNEELRSRQDPNLQPSAPPPSESGGTPTVRSSSLSQQDFNGRRDSGSMLDKIVENGEVQNAPPLSMEEEADSQETEKFASAMKDQIEVFTNRIRSNQARGRSIVNDNSVQKLFLTLTELHAEVLRRLNTLDTEKTYYETLQDKLGELTEKRQALSMLREEYAARCRQQALEEQQRRQHQMDAQMSRLREKKHEMLEMQRNYALQRFQQQEAEIRRQQMTMAYQGGVSVAPGPIPDAYQPIQQPHMAQEMVPGYQQPISGQQTPNSRPLGEQDPGAYQPPVNQYQPQQQQYYHRQVAPQAPPMGPQAPPPPHPQQQSFYGGEGQRFAVPPQQVPMDQGGVQPPPPPQQIPQGYYQQPPPPAQYVMVPAPPPGQMQMGTGQVQPHVQPQATVPYGGVYTAPGMPAQDQSQNKPLETPAKVEEGNLIDF